MPKRDPRDYEAMSREVEADEYTVVGPLEVGPGLEGATMARFTDDEYAEMAADYEANPIRPDEVLGPQSIDPALLSTAAAKPRYNPDEDNVDYDELSRAVEAGEYTPGDVRSGTQLHEGRPELSERLQLAFEESEAIYAAELEEDRADLERALAEDDGEHISLADHREAANAAESGHAIDDEDVDLDHEVVNVDGRRFTEQDANGLADEIARRPTA